MSDLEKAKQRLHESGATCVLRRGEEELLFTARGVRPLVELYESGRDVTAFCAADKVVGKGAAFVYLRLGVRRLYAAVISRAALELLTARGVAVECDTVAAYIRNRRGDGMCPFEQAVLDVTDESEAYRIIREKLAQMTAQEGVTAL